MDQFWRNFLRWHGLIRWVTEVLQENKGVEFTKRIRKEKKWGLKRKAQLVFLNIDFEEGEKKEAITLPREKIR